jgi:hypothetical protein
MQETSWDNAVDWERVCEDANRDRRRETRISMAFKIEVCGFDSAGRFYTEKTETSDISEWGCRFTLPFAVNKTSIVAIRILDRQGHPDPRSKPILFQVMWTGSHRAHWKIGAAKLQPDPAWCLSFPEHRKSKS